MINKHKFNGKILGTIASVFLIVAVFVLSSLLATAETTISKNIHTITLKDSDGDGILDKDDPHPEIAEIYIVEDSNLNGIVDYFETEEIREEKDE